MAEPSPASDADKIRLKRLAKLLQQHERQSAEQQEPIASTSGTIARPPAPTPRQPVPAARPEPVKPVPSAAAPAKVPRIATPQQSQPLRFTESFEEWQHGSIGRILNVTLDVAAAEASSWSVVYLKDVAVELDEEEPTSSRPHKLRADLCDRLMLSRLSLSPSNLVDDPERITVVAALPPNETSFEYLGSCWRRERTERSRVVAKKDSDPQELQRRLDVLNQLKGLLVSYIGLVLMDPSMFPQDHVSGKALGALELEPLLIPSSTPIPPAQLQVGDIPSVFADLALRFTPSAANDFEGGIEDILSPLFAKWNAHLLVNKLDIGGGGAPGSGSVGWRDILQAVQNLTEIKPIATALTTFSNWNVATPSPTGAPSLPQSYFPEPSTMVRGNIDSASASLRGTLRGVQTSLFRIFDNIVRSSPVAREAVLAYLGQAAALNAKRAAMRVDPNTVSTEGFIINLHAVLLRFAEPFMDASFSKIDKIDPLYYKQSSRIDVAEDTKINANKQESDEYYNKDSTAAAPAPNFISDIFFLCAQYLHLGPMHAIKEHKGIGQQVSHMQRQLNDMEADSTWRGTPQEAATKAGIERYKKKIEQWRSFVLAYEVQLLDPDYLAKCASFANLVMAWLVRLVDPKTQHPHVRIDLPLPSETPLAFRMLPEFLIEDITEFLSFTSKYAPQVLETSSQDELMSFMLVFLSTPYMKNPYLKGQFIMYYLSRPTYTSPRGCLGDVLNFHQLALKNLMPCLIHAYIEIEITGSHTQFYDKFNIRYYITQLFKLVWSNPTHREALKRESQVNFDRYVRFVNLLMNDTTYLLDDALVHLGKIGELQRAMDDQNAWEAQPASERQEKEKLLRQYESTVRSDLDLGHESLRLLKLFSQETTQPFLTREIVDRLAAMLDANLQLLAGPRCQELKVKEPEKYKFRPKELLSDVLQIFLNLGSHEQFQSAVAKDGRSYSKELFQRASRIATKTAIKTEEELNELSRMVDKVETIRAAEQEDEAMGEIPDEFLDPLTFEIMEDPVILPSSHTILDRSTIKQHYLSDATDPFNRQPLRWEDITDAVDLREQIKQYLAERRKKKGSAASAGDEMQVDA
ncbi:Ubiquitin conjugation factor E4 [Rhodotorula toruloides]